MVNNPAGQPILYVFGGHFETFTRKTKASLPTGRSDLAAARVTLDGKSDILAVAGTANSDLPNPDELYTP